MGTGIAILGLNGAGKSTLAHRLAKETGFYEMDVEDYYFPEQQRSRKMALEKQFDFPCEHLGELPFSVPRQKAEVEKAIANDIMLHPDFILAGVTMNWCREILSQINAAFFVKTPDDERVRRIRQREEARFGSRVLEGGDMYEQQKAFRRIAADRRESLMKCIPDELWNKRYDEIPMWKYLYHMLYSMDRWYINPCDPSYREPGFHTETLADLNVVPGDEVLERDQLETYFDRIRDKIQHYIVVLKDADLSSSRKVVTGPDSV